MKTLAAILTDKLCGKPLELDEIDIPQLRSGQVLVEISHSGICGTQLNEVDGKRVKINGPCRKLDMKLSAQ